MLVRNWMQANPKTVVSDDLVVDAKQILVQNNLRALLVVDGGCLRGLLTRADCLRAAGFMARRQDPYELEFFTKRLKVKDIMIRNPVTVSGDDTIEHCLLRGQRQRIAQFPVLDNGHVVGLVSAHEIFLLAANLLGACEGCEDWAGITLGPMTVATSTLPDIATVVAEAGAALHTLFAVQDKGTNYKRVIVKFSGATLAKVTTALAARGFEALEAEG